MENKLTNEIVKDFVEKNPKLVTRRESERYPGLFTLKYQRRVFYDNLWNNILVDMRGTVVDKDYNPVVMPFRKIYNRGENGTDIQRDEEVTAVRKINGFMAAATFVPEVGKVVVSTTGSLDSPYVKMAEDYIVSAVKQAIVHHFGQSGNVFTHLFEIVHPDDQTHPIREEIGAYYLGARAVKWNGVEIRNQVHLDDMSNKLAMKRPEWFTDRFSNVVNHTKTVRHEGFVVYGQSSGTALKIKSPHYLITKFLGRLKEDRLKELAVNPAKFKQNIEEEFYPLVDNIAENITMFNALPELGKFNYIKEFLNA